MLRWRGVDRSGSVCLDLAQAGRAWVTLQLCVVAYGSGIYHIQM